LQKLAQTVWVLLPQVAPTERHRALVAELLAHDTKSSKYSGILRGVLPAKGPWSQPGPERWSALLQAWLELAEAGENASARTRLGAFYTPPELVATLLDWALQPLIDQALAGPEPQTQLADLHILDPSCGAGAFLAAAAQRLHAAWQGLDVRNPWNNVLASLHGCDIEPAALAVCGATLRWLAGGQGTVDLREDDFLLQPPRAMAVVVGNPPFLGQMKAATVRSREAHAQILQQLGDAVGPYTDSSALFLARSLAWLQPGGRLALVQPLSLVASRDAAGVRRLLSERAPLQALWLGLAVDFGGASVDVCAPLLVAGGAEPADIAVLYGAKRLQTRLAGEAWSPLLAAALGVPPLQVAGQGVVGDLAQVTADFRDEYYGIQPFVVDVADAGPGLAPLIVTGHIEPLQSLWGQGAIRFAKQRFERPAVDLVKLAAGNPKLAKWAERRRVCKLVVATQSKVIEAAVDVRGEWLNTTPTLAVLPQNPQDLWRLAAVLCCATVTALAWQRHAGTALAGTALKLSAKQLAALPLPVDTAMWQKAADMLANADLVHAATRRSALVQASRQLAVAYQGQVDEAVEGFWLGRLAER
jgi:hypothetical protein